jgi:Rps23 Pro-64 3,4-dihydroxylase Tpa1-like proline 4-hydroxylase
VVNPKVRDRTDELAREFSAAQPFRHVVIDQFLDPAFCEELMAEFPGFDSGQSRNERGERGRKAVFSSLPEIGPAYSRFDRLMRDRDFLALTGAITGIPGLLYDPEYVGGGTHENLDGAELDSHVDFNFHPTRHLHRRLNLIVFLNARWEPGWGGCLELLREPWSSSMGATADADRKIVVPVENRAVIFETTESSWHGFPRITLPEGANTTRRSIAVYFYTKDRPAAETGASHGTIYYQRQLPEHIAAGHTLSAQDVEEIQILIARRDRQIEFLYDRELEFSGAITGITASPSFRIGRALTWPARRLRDLLKR